MARYTSLKEAAQLTGVPAHLVRRMAKQGQLAILQIPGAKPRVDLEEVRRAVARFTRPAQAQTPALELLTKQAG